MQSARPEIHLFFWDRFADRWTCAVAASLSSGAVTHARGAQRAGARALAWGASLCDAAWLTIKGTDGCSNLTRGLGVVFRRSLDDNRPGFVEELFWK